jgi:hypothetical protein
MTHSERGSATIHALFAAVLLLTVLAAAVLWAAISTARHQLAAAADLTALSAAQSVAFTPAAQFEPPDSPTPAEPPDSTGTKGDNEPAGVRVTPTAPCATARRIAELNKVQLTRCDVAADSVTVEVAMSLDLRVSQPTLAATARAGPI